MTELAKAAPVPDEYFGQYDGFAQDWISTSSLSLLMMCPVAWEYKYVQRIREPINVRMTVGKAAHKGRETNLTQKIETQEDLKIEQVKDASRDSAVAAFESAEVHAEKEFEGKAEDTVRGIAVDLSVEYAATDYQAYQVNIIPAAVEKALAVQYPEMTRAIVGKLDTLSIDDWIDDLKTGKRRKNQTFADTNMGLTTYGLLAFVNLGKLPAGYRVQTIGESKGGCQVDQLWTKRTMADLQQQLERFMRACKLIDAGIFMPCNPGEWKCGPNYCGYYRMCKFGGNK